MDGEMESAAARELLDIGLYSVPEAARLTDVSPGRIRRWLRGYRYRTSSGEVRNSPPVWERDLADFDALVVTFRDLIEIRYVDAFIDQGISWATLRHSTAQATELTGNTHPFSSRRFKSDGRRLFMDIAKAGKRDKALLEVLKNQYTLRKIVDPFLFGMEFLKDDPYRWWPLGRKREIVLDPRRSFGHPITNRGGVSTRVLAAGFLAEKSYEKVASWYEVPIVGVRDAVRFENKLAA